MREAEPELLLNSAQWDQLFATPMGVFISLGTAVRLGLKAGDALPIITPPGTRSDGAAAWEFHVLGVVPKKRTDGRFNDDRFILGNLSNVDNCDRSHSTATHGRFAWT
jgi:ABC-type lipoprotein release transport system permease subunit